MTGDAGGEPPQGVGQPIIHRYLRLPRCPPVVRRRLHPGMGELLCSHRQQGDTGTPPADGPPTSPATPETSAAPRRGFSRSRSSAAGATCPSTGCIRASGAGAGSPPGPAAGCPRGMPSSSTFPAGHTAPASPPAPCAHRGSRPPRWWWCRAGERTSYSRLRPSAVSATGTSTA